MTSTRHVLHAFSTVAMIAFVIGVLGAQAAAQNAGATDPKKPMSNGPVVHDLPANVPGHTEFLDYKNGFRGVAFGTSVREFKNLELYRDRGVVKVYRKTDEDLTIGTATVTNIHYLFVHDKFYAVTIHADARNGSQLLKVFEAAFGPAAHPEGTPSQYFWTGNVASAHFFEETDANHEVRGWIGNNELQKDYEQVMREIFVAAAQQL
ncbi:MAG TPA: hypothetical protein VK302_00900 [Terriglobales bacterium]|nr:hypothetical protein [Terriglobales bacterium]